MKLTEIFEFIQEHLPIKTLALIIAISCAFFLFIPTSWSNILGLDSLLAQYKGYIGLIFVISVITFGVLALVDILDWLPISQKITNYFTNKQQKKESESALNALDSEEKAILREFYLQNCNSINTNLYTAIAGLKRKGLIFVDENDGTIEAGYIFISLASGVGDFITQKPSLIGLSADKLTPEKKRELLKDRPSYLRKLSPDDIPDNIAFSK